MSQAELRSLARLQADVVSRDQARAFGLSDRVLARLVAQRQWRRLTDGVYLTVDVDPTFAARAWAGVLIGGEGSRLGGLTAARLHGLTANDPEVVSVLVPHVRHPSPRRGWEFVRERDGVRGGAVRGDPPRTSVEDTVLDLCADASPADIVGWLTVAVQRRSTTARRLQQSLAGRSRHPRRAMLEDLLGDVAVGAESPLEVTYLRDVERAHGLPPAVRQRPSRDRRALRDVRYPEFGVVVELDGRLGHAELGRFRDMDRDNVALLDGLLTLRFGSGDLYGRPCHVAHQVIGMLRLRGWNGLMTRCPRCSLVPDDDWD